MPKREGAAKKPEGSQPDLTNKGGDANSVNVGERPAESGDNLIPEKEYAKKLKAATEGKQTSKNLQAATEGKQTAKGPQAATKGRQTSNHPANKVPEKKTTK